MEDKKSLQRHLDQHYKSKNVNIQLEPEERVHHVAQGHIDDSDQKKERLNGSKHCMQFNQSLLDEKKKSVPKDMFDQRSKLTFEDKLK